MGYESSAGDIWRGKGEERVRQARVEGESAILPRSDPARLRPQTVSAKNLVILGESSGWTVSLFLYVPA